MNLRHTKNIKNGNDKFKDNMKWNLECEPVNEKHKEQNRWLCNMNLGVPYIWSKIY